MQTSNEFNKYIIILGVIVLAFIFALNIILKTNKASKIDYIPSLPIAERAVIDKNISELDKFDSDLSQFAQDDEIFKELDETLLEVGEISQTSENMTKDEGGLSNIDNNISGLSEDEAVNDEIDQTLQSVSL